MEKVVKINEKIPATIYTAGSDEKSSVVILCAGGMSSRNEIGDYYVKLAGKLNEKGISAITFDVAGNGDRVDEEIKSWDQDKNDLMEVVEYLEKNKEELKIDTNNMQIMGYSLGALTAVEAISEHPDMFTNFIAQGPAWTYEEVNGLTQDTFYNYNYPTEDGNFKEYKLDKNAAKDMANKLYGENNIAIKTLKDSNIDYTIVVGENDTDCGIEFLKENFENIEIIPNSDHIFGLFQDKPEEECEKNMENFANVIVDNVVSKEKQQGVNVIDIAKLGAEIGMEPTQQTLPNGKVVNSLVWNQENLLKAVNAVKHLSEEGKPVRITGAAPAWLVSALTHTVHPCPVGVYMPQIGKDVDIPVLAHGEPNPEGEVAFKTTEKGESILIEYNMDLPEGITTYDENNLSKVVVPEVEQGKAVYLSGRGPNYLTVAIAEAYAHTNSSVSLFQPGIGYTCSITHSRAKRLGDLTNDPLGKEELKERLTSSKEISAHMQSQDKEKEGPEID